MNRMNEYVNMVVSCFDNYLHYEGIKLDQIGYKRFNNDGITYVVTVGDKKYSATYIFYEFKKPIFEVVQELILELNLEGVEYGCIKK